MHKLPVPIPKDVITAAVEEYGEAWKTQDWQRIGRLFTKDAIYIERVFDKKATFRGRQAIQDYWKRQICGKQSNIQFRYLDKEVVRDADQPIAVVKWLAAFENTRHGRSTAKTHKQVRFCQMAKLIFAPREEETVLLLNDNNNSMKKSSSSSSSSLLRPLKEYQISYLEEYAQAMDGSGVRWPIHFVTDSSESLWSKLRIDPPPPPPPSICEYCGTSFPSRTKLFAHLQSTTPPQPPPHTFSNDGSSNSTSTNPNGRCREIVTPMEDPPVWLCWSLSYQNSIHIVQDFLLLLKSHPVLSAVQLESPESMIWAVPPELVPSHTALVTVVTTKVTHQSILETMPPLDQWPELLNSSKLDDSKIHIHTVGRVERPCVPARRELERYRCYIPWRCLQTHPQYAKSLNSKGPVVPPSSFSRERNCWRTPIEETAAYQHLDPQVLQRLSKAARLAAKVTIPSSKKKSEETIENGYTKPKDSKKSITIRIRTSTMEEPWERICQISVSFKQPYQGCVEGILRLLLRYAGVTDLSGLATCPPQDKIDFLSDDAFQNELIRCLSSSQSSTSKTRPFPFPILLVEPSLTKYETKMKLPLTQECFFASEDLKRSIEVSSNSLCSRILTELNHFENSDRILNMVTDGEAQ